MDTSCPSDASRNKVVTASKDFKKLGFKSDLNPVLDFEETPPGVLALDCMYYFAKYHVEAYTKVSFC
jgi:engulfment/cell motility protein 1